MKTRYTLHHTDLVYYILDHVHTCTHMYTSTNTHAKIINEHIVHESDKEKGEVYGFVGGGRKKREKLCKYIIISKNTAAHLV